MEPDQEGVFDVLQQHVAFGHDVFLLSWRERLGEILKADKPAAVEVRFFFFFKDVTSFLFRMTFFCRTLMA